jgi:hypothetical protein
MNIYMYINIHTYMYIYNFIPLSINVCLGCFHILAIRNNATMHLIYRYLFEVLILFPLDV